ncbi:bacteriocin-like protein [Chryseobacterium sp. KCF3-3]
MEHSLVNLFLSITMKNLKKVSRIDLKAIQGGRTFVNCILPDG